MLAKALILSALAVAGYMAIPQARSPNDQSYLLTAGADELLFQPLSLVFSCEGREYGYYADAANACQLFHICLPLEDDAGAVIETAQWTFICGNGTMFDQGTLTCNYPQDSVPCEQAEQFYNQVEFGKVESDY